MRVLVIGGDGYCGWACALNLSARGHQVTIVDNLIRRTWDRELGVSTLTPIRPIEERLAAWKSASGNEIAFCNVDVTDYPALVDVFQRLKPESIVNFGQQRSAPFSMIDREHAAVTLVNNTVGNLNVLWAMRDYAPEAHLVKLGTMGEYGTPNIEIEEGFITIEHKGRRDTLPFPKQPGSLYHLTKVSDSDHLYFASRVWGLSSTDLNQGVVYGLHTDETALDPALVNRFDYDGVYGTALNRFCVQAALDHPLTVYGAGGQTRAFLNIVDTVACVRLAVEKPAAAGEFRVFNQYTETFSISLLAKRVAAVGQQLGLRVQIQSVANPRVEKEAHFYSTHNDRLLGLGLTPTLLDDDALAGLIKTALEYRERIDPANILPTVNWSARSREPEAAVPEKAKVVVGGA